MNVCILYMLYFDTNDVSEGIGVNKPSEISEPLYNILNIKAPDYWCIVSGISKNEAIKSIQNTDLTAKSGTL